jgi:hypothetical protein
VWGVTRFSALAVPLQDLCTVAAMALFSVKRRFAKLGLRSGSEYQWRIGPGVAKVIRGADRFTAARGD